MNKKLHLKHRRSLALFNHSNPRPEKTRSAVFQTVLGALVLFVMLLAPGRGWGQVVGWDFSTQTGGSGNFGTSPLTATTKDANVTIGSLTRGSGFGTLTGNGAAAAWGSTNFTASGTLSGEITANKYFTFTVTANTGYKVSLSGIAAYNIRRSSTGPTTGQWQYQIGSGSFVNIGSAITWGSVTTSPGNPQSAIDLSGITDLQNVLSTSTITVRLVCYGASATTGTNYLKDLGNSTTNDLIINGTVAAAGGSAPTVTTQAVSAIGTTTATGNGFITATGGANATSRGICWDVYANPNPDLSDSHSTESGSFSTGAFTGSIATVTAETRYKAVAYATNTTGTGYGSAVNFWTLSTEPSAHSTTFSNTVISQTQIDLSFEAASTITDADGYIILQKTGSAPTGTPTDGNAYAVGNTIGDGTVAAIVASTSATSASITSLSAGTQYYFTIMPYNYNGANNETYNYKTDGSVPVTDGTTSAALASTSEVSGPAIGSQPDPMLISSLVTTEGAAVHVFDMDAYDNGVDGQPTKITQLTIKAGTNNTANWTNTIAGVKLSLDAGSTFATIGTPTITASSIVIPVTSGNLNIPDNGAITISMYIYLKSSGLTDNQILEFKVDATASSHGFVADATGSTFIPTFADAPVSNEMLIDVIATELNFVQQPTNVGTSANITPAVTVSANDANGNTDIDYYVTDVSITATGATLAGSPVIITPISGLATFSTLSFSNAGTGVTLNASSGSLTGETSASFNVILLPAAGEIVINQFNPAYNASSNEYIELVNKTNKTFDLSQCKIMYSSASGSTPSSMGTLSGTLLPYSFWLLSPDATITVGLTSALARDGSFSPGMAAASGQIAIETLGNSIIDGVAYGTITLNKLGEGSPAPTPTVAKDGLKRVTDGVDNNTNSVDFANVPLANIYLRNSNSLCVSDNYTLPLTSYPADIVISGASPNATLSGSTEIAGKLTILAGSMTIGSSQGLTVTGTLTNSAGNTGLVIESGGSLLYGSEVAGTAKCTIATNGNWHLLSSPVASHGIWPNFIPDGSISGFGVGPWNWDFYYWNPNALTTSGNTPWVNMRLNTSGDYNNGTVDASGNSAGFGVGTPTFTSARGYLVSYTGGSYATQFEGNLNAGVKTYTIVANSGNLYNLVGNPYPSSIDWDAVDDIDTHWGRSGALLPSGSGYDYWVWDGSLSEGNYLYRNSSSHLGTAGQYIAPEQGFFVKSDGDGGTLTFREGIRAHSSQSWVKSTNTTANSLILKINTDANSYQDVMFVDVNPVYTGTEGTEKFWSLYEEAPEIYTIKNNQNYSIDRLKTAAENTTVNIGIKAGVSGLHTITADMSSFTPGGDVRLEDLKTGTVQILNNNPVYSFMAAPGDNAHRFVLHFGYPYAINENANGNTINVYASGSNISVINNAGKAVNGNLYVYNLMGQQVMQQEISVDKLTKISLNVPTGYYLVKVVTSDHTSTTKVFINN